MKYKNLLPVYLKGLASGKYTLAQAAASCGYSVGRMYQLKKEYLRVGLSVLEHKGRGRVPANKTPQDVKNKIMLLYTSPAYAGINFKYFCECLNHYENVKINYSTLRNIFKEYGIKSPEAHRIKKPAPAHRPRLRRAALILTGAFRFIPTSSPCLRLACVVVTWCCIFQNVEYMRGLTARSIPCSCSMIIFIAGSAKVCRRCSPI